MERFCCVPQQKLNWNDRIIREGGQCMYMVFFLHSHYPFGQNRLPHWIRFYRCSLFGALHLKLIKLQHTNGSYLSHLKRSAKKKEKKPATATHWKLLSYYNCFNADRNKQWAMVRLWQRRFSQWLTFTPNETRTRCVCEWVSESDPNRTRSNDTLTDTHTYTNDGYHLVLKWNAWKPSVAFFLDWIWTVFARWSLKKRCHIRFKHKLILKATPTGFFFFSFVWLRFRLPLKLLSGVFFSFVCIKMNIQWLVFRQCFNFFCREIKESTKNYA